MTALLSEQVYRTLTQDLRSSVTEVETALLVAQGLVELRLGRALGLGTYTEHLPTFAGMVYPRVTPLDPTQAGYVNSSTLSVYPYSYTAIGDYGYGAGYGYASTLVRSNVAYAITYTGGYTSETLPAPLALGIALVAQWSMSPEGALSMQGMKSFTEGDISATFADSEGDSAWPPGTWTLVRRWAYRAPDAA